MRSHRTRSSVALALVTLAASATAAPAPQGSDIGRLMPGSLHGGFLSNFKLLLEDFPGIAHEGWLGRQIDHWVQKGYSDPRDLAGQLGIGINIQGRSLKDLVVLGQGPLRIAHKIREIARRGNLPIREIPYRGVVFIRPLFDQAPLWISEPTEGVSHFHFNPRSKFEVSKELVDVLQGRRPSYGDKHGMSLDSETYLTAGVQVPIATREAFAVEMDPSMQGIHLVVQAGVDWKRSGTKVQLGIELETFTPVEARLLADWLNGKLDNWKASTQNDFIRTLLHAIEIEALQNHVFLRLFHEWSAAREAVLAWNREVGHAYRQGQVD